MPIRTVKRMEKRVITEVQGFVCNSCGKTEEALDSFSCSCTFHVWQLTGGFEGRFPGDMDSYEIVICEDCLEKWVKSFKYPDIRDPKYHDLPIEAKDSETLAPLIVEMGWVRPAEAKLLKKWAPNVDVSLDFPCGKVWKYGRVWEHFKKKDKYIIIDFAKKVSEPHEVCVVYQALYADSDIWVRPVSEWESTIEREGYRGPRFRRLPDVKTN
jgi:hypothetical protein